VKAPAYTLTPDEIFDSLLCVLSSAELKVLLYVTRRTFGFNKLSGSVGILVEKAKGVIIERIQPKTRTRWRASKGR
jgi:hypothetical protein